MKTVIKLGIWLGVAMLASASGAQERIVRIGHVAPLTGAFAPWGQDSENGARLAIDELNAAGVILDGLRARFELIVQDDAADPAQATAVAHRLVDENVHGVIGHAIAGTSIPASAIYSQAGIPQVSPSETDPRYTRQGLKTTFRVVADDVQLGGALGRYAVEVLKGQTIVAINDHTAYGQGLSDAFEKGVADAGGTIAHREFATDRSGNFMALLTTTKGKHPDIIFLGGMDTVAGPMLRQMRALGLHARVMGGGGLCTSALIELAGDALGDGHVLCGQAAAAAGGQNIVLDAFRARFRTRFDSDVLLWAPHAYDAVHVLVAAMVKAGSADPRVYLPALARTTNHPGVAGTVSFDAQGDIRDGALTLITYRGGKREVLGRLR